MTLSLCISGIRIDTYIVHQLAAPRHGLPLGDWSELMQNAILRR
jgi:hypothetical protein